MQGQAKQSDFRVYSDEVVAREKPPFLPPEDSYIAVCCDVVNLGKREKEWQGKTKLVSECRVDFLIPCKNPETGQFVRVSEYFTVSLSEKANLRKFMEQWRGKAFTQDEVAEGIVLDRMVGAHALISVGIKTQQNGRQRPEITAIQKVPGQLKAEAQAFPVPKDYVRMKDRKDETQGGVAPDSDGAPPHDDEDEIPF